MSDIPTGPVADKELTVSDLKDIVNAMLTVLNHRLGARSSVILMVGIPIPNSEHDRFAANFYGPCLSSRGLLEWGSESIERLMVKCDSSRNGTGGGT